MIIITNHISTDFSEPFHCPKSRMRKHAGIQNRGNVANIEFHVLFKQRISLQFNENRSDFKNKTIKTRLPKLDLRFTQ